MELQDKFSDFMYKAVIMAKLGTVAELLSAKYRLDFKRKHDMAWIDPLLQGYEYCIPPEDNKDYQQWFHLLNQEGYIFITFYRRKSRYPGELPEDLPWEIYYEANNFNDVDKVLNILLTTPEETFRAGIRY